MQKYLHFAKESVMFMEDKMLDPLREYNPNLFRSLECYKRKNGKYTGFVDISSIDNFTNGILLSVTN